MWLGIKILFLSYSICISIYHPFYCFFFFALCCVSLYCYFHCVLNGPTFQREKVRWRRKKGNCKICMRQNDSITSWCAGELVTQKIYRNKRKLSKFEGCHWCQINITILWVLNSIIQSNYHLREAYHINLHITYFN